MRSRRCSGPGRASGDTRGSGRRVTWKAPLAPVVGGSGRSEASPTAILQDTHSRLLSSEKYRVAASSASSTLSTFGPQDPLNLDHSLAEDRVEAILGELDAMIKLVPDLLSECDPAQGMDLTEWTEVRASTYS